MAKRSLFLATCGTLALVAGTLCAAGVGDDPNHPTGTKGLILIDKIGSHVRFFDPSSWTEAASLEVPARPHDFVLSADHKLAYVAIYGSGVYGHNPSPAHEIEIVDVAAHKIVGAIDVSPYRAPHGIQLDQHSDTLYVTCDLDRKVLAIDLKTRKIKKAIDSEGTGHWIGMLPDASKIYVVNKNDRPFISVIDLKSGKMTGKVPAPNGTQGIAVSPDGRTVVAMDFSEPYVIVVDTATDTVRERIRLKDESRAGFKPFFSPDGSKLLTLGSAPAGAIHVFDAHNLHAGQTRIAVGKDPMGVAFSADGKTAVVANHGDGSISVIDLEKMKVTGNFHAGSGIETLAWY
jgi:DNA-binding beta-propeller fold protein YncE